MDQRLEYEHILKQKKIPEGNEYLAYIQCSTFSKEALIKNDRNWFLFSDRIRYLTMTDASKVWMPDTFFRNEKIGAFHTILQPNLYIRIFPDGTVLYSIRQGQMNKMWII